MRDDLGGRTPRNCTTRRILSAPYLPVGAWFIGREDVAKCVAKSKAAHVGWSVGCLFPLADKSTTHRRTHNRAAPKPRLSRSPEFNERPARASDCRQLIRGQPVFRNRRASDVGSLHCARLPGGDGLHPLPGPRRHQPGSADHQDGFGDLQYATYSRFRSLRSGVWSLRDSGWLVGRPLRLAAHPDADRPLVVGIHGVNGRSVGIRDARRHSIPVWRWGGRGIAELGAGAARMVSRVVARACAGVCHDCHADRRGDRALGLAMAD